MFRKRILFPLLVLLCFVAMLTAVVATVAADNDDDTTPAESAGTPGLSYTLSDDGESYVCTGIGNAATTDIVIPATYAGKPVTMIGANAFYNSVSLTSVTIEEGVLAIDIYAFRGCVRLERVSIPDSVIMIGNRAFALCSSLREVTIASSGKEPSEADSLLFDESVFKGCTSLTSFIFPSETMMISRRIFDGCKALAKVTIPVGVRMIDDGALAGCTALRTINYGGTLAQWDDLLRVTLWDLDVTDCTVRCTDGDLSPEE